MTNKTLLLMACATTVLTMAMPVASLAQTAPATTETVAPTPAPEAEKPEAEENVVIVKGAFKSKGAKSAMKMNVDVLDTPFSVQAYSNSFIDSQETASVGDLYNYMTGVKKAGNTGYDITMRGFKSNGDDRNAIMVDGLPGLAGRYGSPPTVGVESVEVVKGPMSVLYGQIQPGGFINLVSKTPKAAAARTLEIRRSGFASNEFQKTGMNGSLDFTGPLNASKTLLYRVVAEATDKKGFRDFSFDKGTYIAPSLSWNIGDRTKITTIYEYRKTDTNFDVGLVVPNRDMSLVAPIKTVYSEPGSFRSELGKTLSVHFLHEISDNLTFKTSYRKVNYESIQKEFSNVSVLQRTTGGPWVVNRRARQLETTRVYSYIDSNLLWKFKTFGIEHNMLLGANAGDNSTDENRVKFVNANCTGAVRLCFDIDVYKPVYGAVPNFDSLPSVNPNLANQSSLLTRKFFESDTTGFYVSDLMSIGEHWKISAGARSFEDSTKITEMRVPNIAPLNKTAKDSFLPSLGVIYQPTDKFSFYGSYAQSYVPSDPNDQDAYGQNTFDPVEGIQHEVGVKTERLFNNKVSGSLSFYKIEQNNALNSFTCPVGTPRAGEVCWESVGTVESKGMELETNIMPTKEWQILLGYAYIDAKIKSSLDPIQVGKPIANTAKHSGSIWQKYEWDNGFGVNMGITYTGERPAVMPSGTGINAVSFTLPAYTIMDVGGVYDAGNYKVSLKVNNVFDKRYFESAGLTAQVQLAAGAPRSVVLSLKTSF